MILKARSHPWCCHFFPHLQEHFQGIIVAAPLELANIKLPKGAAKFAGHGRE